MEEYTHKEIDRLQKELTRLYRGKSTDTVRIDGLWARIERLEMIAAKQGGRSND